MQVTDFDERALIEQARHDKAAFGQLYELYVDRIYNYVYYRTGNVHDAEDLTARIFFRAIQHIDRYQDQGAPFSAWLFRIARNLLANWYRDQGRRTMIPLESVTWHKTTEGPEMVTEQEEANQALMAAINKLPADRQDLLILKFVERLSNAEIGQIMGRSEGAIKSLYHRTLLSLRDDLESIPLQQRPLERLQGQRKSAGQWLSLPRNQREGQLLGNGHNGLAASDGWLKSG